MKILIESTDKLTTVDGVPVRVWRGVTEGGAPCFVFVHRIGVPADQDQAAFERDLKSMAEPDELRAIPLRNIL